MFPSPSRSNTTISRPFSMQNVIAVASITLRPWLMTSMYEMCSYRVAAGSSFGSAL